MHHPAIKFTAEISEKEIPFLDTIVFKGERFYEDAILDIRTLFHTFQYTDFTSCHAPNLVPRVLSYPPYSLTLIRSVGRVAMRVYL